jgi:hypothetical protein
MGRKVVLDRYGRLLIEVAVSSNGAAGPITKFPVAQGLARLAAHAGGAACQSTGRSAGDARLGLCCNPRYFPRAEQDAAGISAERGRFTLVEGKIVWRESGGTIYVNDMNFGRPWREDFTVTIAKRKERQFAAAVLDSHALTGGHVSVRGWIEGRGRPWIAASVPKRIEIVADTYKDRCTGCG